MQQKNAVFIRLAAFRKCLRKGKDYEVSYKNNKKIGDAIVIVKGKGDYTAQKRLHFLIVPKKSNITKASSLKKGQITVKWKKDKMLTGYQVDISRKKDVSVDVKRNEFKASKAGGTVGGLFGKKHTMSGCVLLGSPLENIDIMAIGVM